MPEPAKAVKAPATEMERKRAETLERVLRAQSAKERVDPAIASNYKATAKKKKGSGRRPSGKAVSGGKGAAKLSTAAPAARQMKTTSAAKSGSGARRAAKRGTAPAAKQAKTTAPETPAPAP